jgi:hypothetical protein
MNSQFTNEYVCFHVVSGFRTGGMVGRRLKKTRVAVEIAEFVANARRVGHPVRLTATRLVYMRGKGMPDGDNVRGVVQEGVEAHSVSWTVLLPCEIIMRACGKQRVLFCKKEHVCV